MILLKEIKNYFEKRAEKKLKEYISTLDVKLEKYKKFYGQYAEQYIDIVNDIDFCINEFIKCGGRLIYAYAPDVYNQIKECKKNKIMYCLTEDEDECILNDLVQPVDPSIYYHYSLLYSPLINNYKDYLDKVCQSFIKQGGKFIFYKDNDIHNQIKHCKDNNIEYIITTNKEFVKQYEK